MLVCVVFRGKMVRVGQGDWLLLSSSKGESKLCGSGSRLQTQSLAVANHIFDRHQGCFMAGGITISVACWKRSVVGTAAVQEVYDAGRIGHSARFVLFYGWETLDLIWHLSLLGRLLRSDLLHIFRCFPCFLPTMMGKSNNQVPGSQFWWIYLRLSQSWNRGQALPRHDEVPFKCGLTYYMAVSENRIPPKIRCLVILLTISVEVWRYATFYRSDPICRFSERALRDALDRWRREGRSCPNDWWQRFGRSGSSTWMVDQLDHGFEDVFNTLSIWSFHHFGILNF